MRKILLLSILLCVYGKGKAQQIEGNLQCCAGQKVTLTGFKYLKKIELAKGVVGREGVFILKYPQSYIGMGVLVLENKTQLVLFLDGADIKFKGTNLQNLEDIHFLESVKNQRLQIYAKAQTFRDKAIIGWDYLLKIYKGNKQKSFDVIKKEKEKIEKEELDFLKTLPSEGYLKRFILLRKFVLEMPKNLKMHPENVVGDIGKFRSLDFSNENFKTTGLLESVLEGHFMLLENYESNVEERYLEMKKSIDYLMQQVKLNSDMMNEVADWLFHYFEKRSLFKASEYLALTLLETQQCNLKNDLKNKFEGYRKLKVGNIAPDIEMNDKVKLSDIKKKTLLVFGVSTCQFCMRALEELKVLYKKWKEKKNFEIVYISMDTDKKEYDKNFKNTPWLTFCDFKGWENKAVKDYYITGTPSCFLLDEHREILVKPVSVAQVDAWLHYKL